MQFHLCADQVALATAWIATLPPTEYHGAIDGALTYEFTPTGLGLITRIIYCQGTTMERSIDLTDYGSW